MNDLIRESLQGIGPHVVYFVLSLIIAILFIVIYVRVTPFREFALIEEGNAAAAISLGGSLLGFSLPLALAVAQSGSVADMLIWAAVAFAAQLIAYLAVRVLMRNLASHIQEGKIAPAIFLAAVSVSIGVLNAAAMTD
jgi:putative membrane protein